MTVSAIPSKRFSTTTSILLFIVALALWQIYDLIMLYISPPTLTISILYLTIPSFILVMFILFTKLSKSALPRQGYKKTANIQTSKCTLLSIVFIIIYILIYLFPAFSTGNFFFRGVSTSPFAIAHRIISAVLLSLAAESVFRGYIFRNLTKNLGFFTSLYVSSILFALYNISIRDVIGISLDEVVIYVFTRILPSFAAGLFLGYFFYKVGWSLLGSATFAIGIRYFLDPMPIVSSGGLSPWWMSVTLDAMSYIVLIFIVDSIIKEPTHVRRRYGLEK